MINEILHIKSKISWWIKWSFLLKILYILGHFIYRKLIKWTQQNTRTIKIGETRKKDVIEHFIQ